MEKEERSALAAFLEREGDFSEVARNGPTFGHRNSYAPA
jgi:hypothetical protein